MLRRKVAGLLLRAARWKTVGEVPDRGVLVGAPHTSNWDFLLMLAITWDLGIESRFLGKLSLFHGPLGPVTRALGGIPVDRSNPAGLVDDVVRRVRAGERVLAFISTLTTFGTAVDVTVSELSIESFFPADPDTADALREFDVTDQGARAAR